MRSIPDIRGAVRERSSLIHCITNPISINQCANAILAVGGRPIMAEHPREVSEITATAGAASALTNNPPIPTATAICPRSGSRWRLPASISPPRASAAAE